MNNYSDTTKQILAIESVPVQIADFDELYNTLEGLVKGTVFPELYLPFCCEKGGTK